MDTAHGLLFDVCVFGVCVCKFFVIPIVVPLLQAAYRRFELFIAFEDAFRDWYNMIMQNACTLNFFVLCNLLAAVCLLSVVRFCDSSLGTI